MSNLSRPDGLLKVLHFSVATFSTICAAFAGTVIVPGPFATREAGGGSSVLNDNIRLQEIYGAAALPEGPIRITEIRFRPSAFFGRAFTSSIPNIQIN